MNKFNPAFIAIVILCITTGIEAQDLQIARDNKSITFKTGTLIRIDVPVKEGVLCTPCKDNYLVGRIASYKNDTLTFHVFYESEPIMEAKNKIGSQVNYYEFKNEKSWPVIKIPKSSIYSITKQGKKKWKPTNDGDLLGASFTTVGILFLSAAVFAQEESNSDALVGAGAIMAGTGLVMISSFHRITYHLENSPNHTGKEKVWNIR